MAKLSQTPVEELIALRDRAMKKKKFVVVATNQEDWDEPKIVFIDAEDEDTAIESAEIELGYNEDDVPEEEQERISYTAREIK